MKNKKNKQYSAEYGMTSPWDWRENIPQRPNFDAAPNVQPLGNTMDYSPYPSGQIEVQPMDYNTTQQSSQPQKSPFSNFGKMATNVGRAAGQIASSVAQYGPQLLNAILPEQQVYREDRTLPQSYSPFPQGTGSQAIYQYGGEMESPYKRRTRRAGKKGRIKITEDIPVEDYIDAAPSPFIGPLPMEPMQTPYLQQVAQPVQQEAPKSIRYERLTDVAGMPTAYAPIFSGGYSYREAEQDLRNQPEYINNIPVVRTPYQYRELFQNFFPTSQGYEWSPYPDEGYNPQPLPIFKDGGSLNSAKSRSKKKYGGYVEGDTVDLSPEEIERLISMGYQLEF